MKKKIHLAFSAFVLPLVFLATLLSQACSRSEKAAPFLAAFPESLGHALGSAVAADFPNGGEVLVVFAPGASQGIAAEITEKKLAGLRQALPAERFTITQPQGETVTEEDEVTAGHFSPERWASVLAQAPRAVAMVSFSGIPTDEVPRLTLPLYADLTVVSGVGEEAVARLRAYVQVRADADFQTQPPAGAGMAEVFALRYELMTR